VKGIIAAAGGDQNMRRNEVCTPCHYTMVSAGPGKPPTAGTGTSCEGCHGPSSDWLPIHNSTAPKPEDYMVFGKPLSIEPYAIMLPKDDPAFKKLIDQEMRRLILNGEVGTLYTKWFLQPIPPKNITLGLPMSYILKDSFKYPSDKVGDL
jgi:hypothetical protein